MTTARSQIVDTDLTRYYHCISRCVRGAFLCGEGYEHRKDWIEQRIELLAANFALSVAGFSVMDNHIHVLLRLDPDDVSLWSDEEVLRRWIRVYPPSNLDFDDPNVLQMWLDHHVKDKKRIQEFRKRLADMGWFMKALKEPLSRIANKEDGCKGAFWEGRFKSIAILDEEALLSVCAYIDLNPVAAGVAAEPETSKHTSVRQRVSHVRKSGKIEVLKEAKKGTAVAMRSAKKLDVGHWLIPMVEQRKDAALQKTSSDSQGRRAGLFDSISLGSYIAIVEYTGRLFRNGKARISPAAADVFERLETSAEFWYERMKKLLSSTMLRGRFFATDGEKVRSLAEKRGVRHLANLAPQASG